MSDLQLNSRRCRVVPPETAYSTSSQMREDFLRLLPIVFFSHRSMPDQTNQTDAIVWPKSLNPYDYTLDEELKSIFLDPPFCRSLGKAMGWGKADMAAFLFRKMMWHRFIDHLAEAKTAAEFFETL
jgi:hypothetical protein